MGHTVATPWINIKANGAYLDQRTVSDFNSHRDNLHLYLYLHGSGPLVCPCIMHAVWNQNSMARCYEQRAGRW